MDFKKINSILISVFDKEGLAELLPAFKQHNVKIYSTGGTYTFIKERGFDAIEVEEITSFPSILGGRVKTLHPGVFGGILARRANEKDQQELAQYHIPEIDAVMVDLYPFEATVASSTDESAIIEKIDIGGVSLIRAAAKNHKDVLIIPSKRQYNFLHQVMFHQNASTSLADRQAMARAAFAETTHYDGAIRNWMMKDESLRYGENPHQKALFNGEFENLFEQLNGKAISYNNLLDMDAAMNLIIEFNKPTVAVLKHNNACGIASAENGLQAWEKALAGDPVAAFGGVVVSNVTIDLAMATAIHPIFLEVLIAPSYTEDALQLLKEKKNRIILLQKNIYVPQARQRRTILNGSLEQDYDNFMVDMRGLNSVTGVEASESQLADLQFANKVVKHLKSNAIALVKNEQLIGSGCGQTSRVDALYSAINKAKQFNFDLSGAVMASDAFFPFPDCVEIADKAGINAIVQPGGSLKDQASIDYCTEHKMAMYMSGHRHFRH